MKDYLFLCGGAPPEPFAAANVVQMDVSGSGSNVNLRLTDVQRALLANLPDLLVDLLEIAAYVYCADQRAGRGTEKLSRAGEDWRRNLRFVIPVRCPERWTNPIIRDHLEETLSYLSDDRYEFRFVASSRTPAPGQLYFTELRDSGSFEPDDVVLFSGGTDSLAGTVDALTAGKKLVLVGHHSAPKVVAVQKELVRALRHAGYGAQLLHVTVNVTNSGVDPVESTQRSRSFLFASLAFVLARMFNLNHFTFYENGVVSLNLPIAGDVLGARATRTTHPKVIRGFERFFSNLADGQTLIATPFLWLTKKEVIERLIIHGRGDLLDSSVSCVHPIGWTSEVRHCGSCSQCIDRRFAVLAADAEGYDKADGYHIDLLTGDRGHEDPDPAIAYVKFARTVSNLAFAQLQSEFPQVSAALHSVPGMAAPAVLDRIWDLHRRHGSGVLSVISAATKAMADDLVNGRLAPGCLLRLSFSQGPVQHVGADTTAQTAAFIDRLSAAECEFAVDEIGQKICFRGGYTIGGAGYRLIRELVGRHREAKQSGVEVPFYWTANLALALGLDDTTLRQKIGRLRNQAETRLAVDQGAVFPNGFIENRVAKGYRLSPELKEVTLGDLNARCHN